MFGLRDIVDYLVAAINLILALFNSDKKIEVDEEFYEKLENAL